MLYNKGGIDITNKLLKYPIKNDIVFRHVFSDKVILRAFLEAVLNKPIEDLEITNNYEVLTHDILEKAPILDIRARIKEKDIINLEMQNGKKDYYNQRVLVYTSQIMSSELKRGDDYENYKNVIVINVLNYIAFEDIEQYHTVWSLREEVNKDKVLDGLEIHYIELPKCREKEPNFEDKFWEWLIFIDGENERLVQTAMKENEIIDSAMQKAVDFESDEKARWLIEAIEFGEMDRRAELSYAKKEGLKEATKEIIISMLQNNFSDEQILTATKITKEDLEKIKKEIK